MSAAQNAAQGQRSAHRGFVRPDAHAEPWLLPVPWRSQQRASWRCAFSSCTSPPCTASTHALSSTPPRRCLDSCPAPTRGIAASRSPQAGVRCAAASTASWRVNRGEGCTVGLRDTYRGTKASVHRPGVQRMRFCSCQQPRGSASGRCGSGGKRRHCPAPALPAPQRVRAASTKGSASGPSPPRRSAESRPAAWLPRSPAALVGRRRQRRLRRSSRGSSRGMALPAGTLKRDSKGSPRPDPSMLEARAPPLAPRPAHTPALAPWSSPG